MANAIKKISYQDVCILPMIELANTDGVGSCLLVETPHKGVVSIKLQETTGFFTRTNRERLAHEVSSGLIKLETEAKDFLLHQWAESHNKNS